MHKGRTNTWEKFAGTFVKVEKASKSKRSKVQTSSKTEDMKVVIGQSRTESVEHISWIAQFEGYLHERHE